MWPRDRPRTRLAHCGIPALGQWHRLGGRPGQGASGWAVVKRRLLAWRTECALSRDSMLRALWAGKRNLQNGALVRANRTRGGTAGKFFFKTPLSCSTHSSPYYSPAQPSPRPPALSWLARPSASMDERLDAVERESEGCCWWWRGLGGTLAHLTL